MSDSDFRQTDGDTCAESKSKNLPPPLEPAEAQILLDLALQALRGIEPEPHDAVILDKLERIAKCAGHQVKSQDGSPRAAEQQSGPEIDNSYWGKPQRLEEVDDMNGQTWSVSTEGGHGYFKAWTSEPGGYGDGPGRDWVYIEDPGIITLREEDGSEATCNLGAVRACMIAAGWHVTRSSESLAMAMGSNVGGHDRPGQVKAVATAAVNLLNAHLHPATGKRQALDYLLGVIEECEELERDLRNSAGAKQPGDLNDGKSKRHQQRVNHKARGSR